MPQLDFTTFAPQLFWLVVSFAVLYMIMARIALPRISDVLRSRRERIDNDLQRAESLKAEAEAALAAYEESLAGARNQAHRIVTEAVQQAADEAERRNQDITARLAEEADAAEARIAVAKDAALADLKTVAGEAAGLVVAKLIGVEADPAILSAAVETASERQSAG